MRRKTLAALQAALLLWSALLPAVSAAPLVKLTLAHPVTGPIAPIAVFKANVPAHVFSAAGLKAAPFPVVSLVPTAVTVAQTRTGALSVLKSLSLNAPEAAFFADAKSLSSAKVGSESNFMQAAFGQGEGVAPEEDSRRDRLDRGLFGDTRRELTLDNGLKVILVSQPFLNSATIAVGYEAGGRDEGPAERGFSHFIEHMMYQGSKKVKNWFRMISAMGAQTNASTGHSYSIHEQKVPINMLDIALALEAERMENLEITPEKVEREKKTILEEQLREVEEQPWERGSRKLTELMFSNPHNQTDVIGSQDDIRAVTAGKLQRYLKENYTTDRTRVAIVGGIDLDAAEKLVRETLGRVPATRSSKPKTDLSDPEKPGRTATVVDPTAPMPAVYFGWRAPAYGTPEYYATDLAVIMIQDRLAEKLLGANGKALGVNIIMSSLLRGPGHIRGAITQAEGFRAQDAEEALQAEIDALAAGDFSDAELQKAIGLRVEASRAELRARENAFLRVLAAVHGASESDLERDLERSKLVARAQVAHAARALLSAARRSTVKVVPGPVLDKPKASPQTQSASTVDEAPTPEEQGLLDRLARTVWPEFVYEAKKAVVLPNGLKVFFVPASSPKTYATLAFKLAPTAADAKARAMLPFMATLLKMRTATKDETAIDEALWAMNASLDVSAADHVVFDGTAPVEKAQDLLALLDEMLTRPFDWTDAELARYKTWYKQAVMPGLERGRAISHSLSVKQLLGAGHPAANADTTPEAVDAMTPAEFAALLRRQFVPDNAVLVLAGGVPEDLESALPGLFADWKPSGAAHPEKSPATVLKQGKLALIDHGPVQQSYIRATGISDIGPGSPDYHALIVADHILGSGYTSRLWQTLRQAFGYAYHASSQIVWEPGLSMWTATLETQTGKTEGAVKALLEQLRLLSEKAPSELELGTAKNALIGGFWMQAVDVRFIASQLAALELYGQPAEKWGEFAAKIAAVTAEDVLAVSRKLWDPEKTHVAVVGDALAVRAGLAKVMPVQEYDADGNPKEPPAEPGVFAQLGF